MWMKQNHSNRNVVHDEIPKIFQHFVYCRVHSYTSYIHSLTAAFHWNGSFYESSIEIHSLPFPSPSRYIVESHTILRLTAYLCCEECVVILYIQLDVMRYHTILHHRNVFLKKFKYCIDDHGRPISFFI